MSVEASDGPSSSPFILQTPNITSNPLVRVPQQQAFAELASFLSRSLLASR